MKLHFNVSYDDVKNNQQPTVYYSAKTRWWTDDPADLGVTKPLPNNIRPAGADDNYGAGLPCDIFGCVLFEIPKADFLVTPERLIEFYGDVDVLMAMHHKNFTPDPGERIDLFSEVEYFQMAVKAFKEVRKSAESNFASPAEAAEGFKNQLTDCESKLTSELYILERVDAMIKETLDSNDVEEWTFIKTELMIRRPGCRPVNTK